jgi:hypothetical protein
MNSVDTGRLKGWSLRGATEHNDHTRSLAGAFCSAGRFCESPPARSSTPDSCLNTPAQHGRATWPQ